MAGLIDLIRAGRFLKAENILFLHTGGSAALFGYQETCTGESIVAPCTTRPYRKMNVKPGQGSSCSK